MKQLFATTARGFEELLKVELIELGATECKIAQGGVCLLYTSPSPRDTR